MTGREEKENGTDCEFEWQQNEGTAPTRKKMLCFTLRRIVRLR